VFQDLRDVSVVAVRAHHGFGLGIVGNVLHIVRRIDKGDRDGHGAGFLNSQPGRHPLDAVGEINDHPGAGLDAHGPDTGGEPVGHFAKPGIGERGAQIDDGGLIGIRLGHAVECFRDSGQIKGWFFGHMYLSNAEIGGFDFRVLHQFRAGAGHGEHAVFDHIREIQ
jgi:hypothetical protein